jgi:hypothetical protein
MNRRWLTFGTQLIPKKTIRRITMPLPIDFDFESDETLRCKGKPDTDKADAEGEYFGNFFVNNRWWALVLWDGEEDPDLFKAELLLVETKQWKPLKC